MVNTTSDPKASPPTALVERLVNEGLIDMRTASKLYTSATHKSTPIRHAIKGVKLPGGQWVKLESLMIGGRLMTSRAAVLRFFARQNDTPETTTTPLPRSPHARNRAAQAAAAELDAMGVK